MRNNIVIARYNLNSIKEMIRDGDYLITNSARVSYTQLGFSDDEAIATVLDLKHSDIYKTMPSHQNPDSWQDVYHKKAKGMMLYIKLQIVHKAIVISFKEK